MKRFISYSKRVAGLALVISLVIVMSQADTPALHGATPIAHSRVLAHRNEDGSLKRSIRNEVETSNWSGYAVANFSTGLMYSAVQASWTVPTVSYVPPPPVCHSYRIGHHQTSEFCSTPQTPWEYSSSWIGIGGYCENAACTSVDSTLIQLGTEHDASSKNGTEYYAWIEMLPNYPLIISPSYPNCQSLSCAYPVHPGDAITTALTCQSNCTPGQSQSWLLTMTNKTSNWTWSTQVTYASSLLSAEWIQEAPSSSGGVLPLADFGTASFVPTINAQAAPNFPAGPNGAVGADAILMVDPYGETSNPSVASTSPLDAFNVCWGNNASNIGTCKAP